VNVAPSCGLACAQIVPPSRRTTRLHGKADTAPRHRVVVQPREGLEHPLCLILRKPPAIILDHDLPVTGVLHCANADLRWVCAVVFDRVPDQVLEGHHHLRTVTLDRIRQTVRLLFGVSISANTIRRNEGAYAAYRKHRMAFPPVKPGYRSFAVMLRAMRRQAR
jgi:hypothetical protein